MSRRYAPVFLPESSRDGPFRQTFLRHYDGCPRSAFLYAKHETELPQTAEMVRGTALHAIVERSIRLMVEKGERGVPPEVVKAIVNEVLGELPVPIEEHDYIREMAFRWADETIIAPRDVVACETLFTLDVGGIQLRARLDFAERTASDRFVVRDWKSSRWAPPFDAIARKRPGDRTLAAKGFQMAFYGVMLMFGLPAYPGVPVAYPLATSANSIDLEYVYPGIETAEGMMLRRRVSLSRLELAEYHASFLALAARVRASERTGDWPAVVSAGACGECPCPAECPIPRALRHAATPPANAREATDVAELLYRASGEIAKARAGLKAYVKATGQPVRFGKDRIWDFTYRESRRPSKGLDAARQLAIDRGQPFDEEAWVKTVQGTWFTERQLTDDELEIEGGGEVRYASDNAGA